MNHATQHTSELERLADDVRHGRKALLFPPGQAFFIGAIILSLFGFAATAASSTYILTNGLPVSTRAITQMASIILIIPGLIIPAFMVTRGKRQYASWMRAFSSIVALVAFAMLILNRMH